MSPDAVYISQNGIIVEANRAAAALFGFSEPGQLVGRAMLDFAHADSRGIISERGKVLYGSEAEVPPVEEKLVHPDGRVIQVEVKSRSFMHQGQLLVQSIARDITDRRRSEQALRISEEFNRSVIENSPIGITVRDRQGRMISCNRAWMRIWGLTEQGVKEMELAEEGRSIREKFPHMGPHLDKLEQLYRNGGSLEIPELLSGHDTPAGARWIKLYMFAIPDAEGRVDRVVSMTDDITDQKQAEQELVSFKRQLEYVLDATRTSVVVIDSDLNIRYLSPGWERRYGPVSGQKCHQYFEKKDRQCRTCRIMEAVRARKKTVSEQHPPGEPERTVQVHVLPFQDEAGQWLAAEFTIDITDLKKIQSELARRQREVMTLLDNIPAGVFFKDTEGRYLLANRNFCEVVGVPQERIAGKTDDEIFSPEAAERSRENEALALSGDSPRLLGESEVTQAGQRLTVETRMVPVRDEQGAAVGIIGIHYNVTERKRAEEQVRMSALQWQTTFDAMGDGIALLDGRGLIMRCNSSLGRLLGSGCDQLLGRESCGLVPGQVGEGRSCMDSLREKGERISEEFKSGDRWLNITYDPIFGTDRSLEGAVFILKDITEVRRAQEAARMLITAIEQMEEGVVMADVTGKISYVNPAAERITGYALSEVLGRESMVPADHVDHQFKEYWDGVWRQVARDRVWSGAKTSRRKDGTTYEQELVVSAVHNPRGEPISYLIVFRDVTERKRLQAIAEAANNMNNIGFIFSGVRHELGNPVNSIKVATSVLRQDFDTLDDTSKKEYLERITSDVQRLESLLKVLHSFSMFENLSLGPVEMCSFIRDLMPTIEPDFARAGIEFKYLFPGNGCRVQADRRALYQIVVNLLTNAFNALSGRERPAIAIRLECREAGNRLTVEDNGAGMTAEVKGNVFKPFYTTRPGGTGLGMVICQKLVLAMNGYIDIDSSPGQGTKVTITLPGA